MRVDGKDLAELDMEFMLDRESIAYKSGRGRSGMQLNVRECPVCHDRRYRVYLNADTGQGNCFICNSTFSKVSFIKAYLDSDWVGAFRFCEEVLREQGWRPRRQIEAAVEVPATLLPISVPLPMPEGNHPYLENRGITGDWAKYFHLYYSEYGFWRYKNEDGKWISQDFSDRIIIPVFDLDGTLKTYQGRDITGKASKKYLFPSTLPGTGRYLLNGHNFTINEDVIMNEGFFDVAATAIALSTDRDLSKVLPIGSFGKHLSYGSQDGDDQLGRFLQLRRRGLKRVTIMWDGEEKALISALDAARQLSRIGLIVRIALLPKGKDPNEVSANVVLDAFYKAQDWSPALDAKLRLKNPFRGA